MSNWKRNTKISSIVINTEILYEALIQLAYAKLSCSQGQRKILQLIIELNLIIDTYVHFKLDYDCRNFNSK